MTLIAVALAILTDTSSYPIPPQPLRWVYRGADLVVVATPGKTTTDEKDENIWDRSSVTLTIRRTLKGKVDGNQVTVRYCADMVCPAPPHYPEGKSVIAFLCRNAKLNAYQTVALSYGTKVLDEEKLKIYLRRIEELEKIAVEKKPDEPSDETVNRLVRCIEDPATCWEGAYEFAPAGSEARYYDRGARKPIPLTRITREQWKRIVDSFVATKTLTWGDATLLDLLSGIPNPRIDAFLLDQLKGELARKEPGWSGRLMEVLATRLDLKGATEIVNAYQDEKDTPTKLNLIRQFLHLVEKEDRCLPSCFLIPPGLIEPESSEEQEGKCG